MTKNTPEIKTFLANVEQQSTGCWHWTGPLTLNRYGRTSSGKDRYAHRRSYTLFVGSIPPKKVVRHLCNNTICVNPKHLAVGSMVENYQDSVIAGTAPSGERNGRAKHNREIVRQVRRLHAQGINQRQIGRLLGIHKAAVWEIVHRRRWKHVE